MRSMMRLRKSNLRKFGTILFVLSMTGCAVSRPNSDACWINAPGSYKRCYNLLKDYDNNGNRLPNATPEIVPIGSLGDLNGHLCVDPKGQSELKRFLDESRREYAALKARCGGK